MIINDHYILLEKVLRISDVERLSIIINEGKTSISEDGTLVDESIRIYDCTRVECENPNLNNGERIIYFYNQYGDIIHTLNLLDVNIENIKLDFNKSFSFII